MKIRREIIVGLFGLAGLAMLIVGVRYLEGRALNAREMHLTAHYDNVDGLAEGSVVFVNGFQAGVVEKVDVAEFTGKLRVVFTLRRDLKLARDTEAHISDFDFFGTKCLRLIPGAGRDPITDGDTLRGVLAQGMVNRLAGQAEPLIGRIDTLLAHINVVAAAARATVQDSANRTNRIAKSVETTTANLAELSGKLTATLERINRLTDSVNALVNEYRGNPDLKRTLANTAAATDGLREAMPQVTRIAADARQATQDLKTILMRVEQGEGSLGKALKDPAMYNNLEASTKNLELLLKDLRERPHRYVHLSVFGRKSE